MLDVAEAIRRIDKIMPLLAHDVGKIGDMVESLEAGNAMVRVAQDRGIAVDAAFNIIQQSMALALAGDLARAFDLTANRPMHRQEKASIPVLAYLLRLPRVHEALLKRARDRNGLDPAGAQFGFQQDIAACLSVADNGGAAEEFVTARRRIRELRTKRLAHNLYDEVPEVPLYRDLFVAADLCHNFWPPAYRAIVGIDPGIEVRRAGVRDSARTLWARALGIED